MTATRDKSYDESLTVALTDPEEAAAYLDAVIDMEDPATLVAALRQVAAAHGMAEVARRTALGDKTLFRSLGDNGNPTLATLQKVLHALGLRLSVQPAETHAA
jgi:probable addiction module antidote protein